MTLKVEEREKPPRGRPPREGPGVPVRVPVDVAKQARIVGSLEGKTIGEVLVEHARATLAEAYRVAAEARERYEAGIAGRRPAAPGEFPGPRSETPPSPAAEPAVAAPSEALDEPAEAAEPKAGGRWGGSAEERRARNERIRRLVANGLSQRAVADREGLSTGAVNKIVNEGRKSERK